MSEHTQKQAQWSGPVDPESNSSMRLSTAVLIYCMLPFIAAGITEWYWDRPTPPHPMVRDGGAARRDGERSGSAPPAEATPSPWDRPLPAGQARAPHMSNQP
jgi:hypothetical protein